MCRLDGEMTFIPGARILGKLFSWKRMYDFYQGGEGKKTRLLRSPLEEPRLWVDFSLDYLV